jgi:malate dehydrogenase (quinone)
LDQLKRNPVVLVGAGIMSATLAVMLKELDPDLHIEIYESLELAAAESTDAWNNAGTGHSAFCELNYTPMRKDGSIDISKAIHIAESFETSKEFWSFLVAKKYLGDPSSFINPVPHMSVVWGEDNATFLKKRFEAMTRHPLFSEMQFSDKITQLEKWVPLMMKSRDPKEKMAATYMEAGTDVNFGSLTRQLISCLEKKWKVRTHFLHEVKTLKKQKNGIWKVKVRDHKNHSTKSVFASFVFIGAGGKALPLLERSGIPESKGFGGFPVSGQWLICHNKKVIADHHVKAYGKAAVGTPPMSMPHLDSRIIGGEKKLLFGPFAGLTTKFLKTGSVWDLFKSIRLNNIIPLISAGIRNIPLTKYLARQVTLSPEDRLEMLRVFVPSAKLEDWKLAHAGMRVQIIKKDEEHGGGMLEFGTELVSASDGSLAALLGASPGASVSVSIMLDLLKKCFPEKINSPSWKSKLKEMIPTYALSAEDLRNQYGESRKRTATILNLNKGEPPQPGFPDSSDGYSRENDRLSRS